MKWRLAEGYSQNNETHYKIDQHTVLQCHGSNLVKLSLEPNLKKKLGKPLDFVYVEMSATHTEESKDSGRLATIQQLSEEKMVQPQIFSTIQYSVIYEKGLVLVLASGSIKRIYHFEDFFPFDDYLVQKIALKINQNGFEGYFLSHGGHIIWVKLCEHPTGDIIVDVKNIRTIDGPAGTHLFQTFLSYNIFTSLDLHNKVNVWDISPLLRKVQQGELLHVSHHLRPFHNTLKPGSTSPFQMNPAMYLYLESQMSELVFNVMYLGQNICTSLCIYDGVNTPFQVIATSMGRIFVLPLFQLSEVDLPVICQIVTGAHSQKDGDAHITSLAYYNSQIIALGADSSVYITTFSFKLYQRGLDRFQGSMRRSRSEFQMKRLSKELNSIKRSRIKGRRHSYDFSLGEMQVLPNAYHYFSIKAEIIYKRVIRPARELHSLKIKNIRRRNAMIKFGARNLGSAGGGGYQGASKAWFGDIGQKKQERRGSLDLHTDSAKRHPVSSESPERRPFNLKGMGGGFGISPNVRSTAGIAAHDLHSHDEMKLKEQELILHQDYQKNVIGIVPGEEDGVSGNRFVLISLMGRRVLRQLRGHDGPIIGAYTLDDMEYLVLTSSQFSFYFYSLASGTLERKANFAQAFLTLSIQERFAETIWRFRNSDIHDYMSFDGIVNYFKRSGKKFLRKNSYMSITSATGMEPFQNEEKDSDDQEFTLPKGLNNVRNVKPMGLPIQRDLLFLMTSNFLPTQFDSFRLTGATGTFNQEYNVAISILLDTVKRFKLAGYDPAQELHKQHALSPSQLLLELFNRTQYIGNELASADIAEMRQDVMFMNTKVGTESRQFNVMMVSLKQVLKNLIHHGKLAQFDVGRGRNPSTAQSIGVRLDQYAKKGSTASTSPGRSSTKKRRIVPIDKLLDVQATQEAKGVSLEEEEKNMAYGVDYQGEGRGSSGSLYLASLKQNLKWPLSLFSLFHFFGASEELDQDLVKEMGYLPPTVLMFPGTSGVDRSFSFVIDTEEQAIVEEGVTLSKDNASTWLTSSHLTTIQSTAFLSSLTAIAEYHSEEFIAGLVDSWLQILFAMFENDPRAYQLSFPTLSKLVIRTDINISATARDLILKPFLSKASLDKHIVGIRAWGDLLERSYQMVRKDPYFMQLRLLPPEKRMGFELIEDHRSTTNLGELEFRALTSVAFFSLPHGGAIDGRLIRRCANLILVLLREMSTKLRTHSQYLIVLLQLLSSGLRIYNDIYKKILDGILLLIARLYYKVAASTPTEYKKIVRLKKISGDKFLLIKPENELNFLKITATKAMIEIGNVYPSEFIDFLQSQVANTEKQDFINYTNSVLDILKVYVKRQPTESLEPYLVRLFQILLKCFEPSDQALRKNTQTNVTQILRLFVERFPMVSFHQASQRIAIGTTQSLIAIYDLRTAQKWRVFEGHTSEITMLHFSDTGKYLASYSHSEKQLKIWKVGNTGFFSSIIGLQGRAQKSIDLRKENEISGLAKDAARNIQLSFQGAKENQIQVAYHPFFKKVIKIK